MPTDNVPTYNSLSTIFEAGKLVGDDMNLCYLSVERAAKNFAAEQVPGHLAHISLMFTLPLFIRNNYLFPDRSL